VAGGVVALGLAGCPAPDEITHYQAPKSEPVLAAAPSGPVRLVVATVPHEDQTWFFKLTGPADDVEAHRKEFDQFLDSVHFTGKADPPVDWKLPADWKAEPGPKERYATYRLGKDGDLELTVTHFGPEARQLLPNVNRWRGQIGLHEVGEDEVGKFVSDRTVDGIKATVVDLTGPGGKGPRMPPFARGGAGGAPPAAAGVPTFTAPPGWKQEARPTTPFAVAEFTIEDGDRRAIVTVSLAGGDPLANVARWRTQLHLPQVGEEELRKDVRPIEVDGIAGEYADLVGPEAAGRQRILGVIVPRGGQTWFFKMRGPADLVERQKSAFEAFLKSVRFGAGPGGKHG
jgi:hypothetical protein